ncbi:MAG: hypothetical protein A2Z16_07360 [Chloroflexi bacterium RBG_16_54_18]|nr:MAG: hypothetical protein A2Z16_07360 [Chloroflexi bacterium RBG_16_54_18]
MNDNSYEKRVEEALERFLPEFSERLDRRLANAPWTVRAAARRRLGAVAACAVLALALFAALTPQGRAAAQSVLRFFTRADSEAITLPSAEAELVPATPRVLVTQAAPAVQEEGCGTVLTPHCSRSQVQALVDFPVLGLDVSGNPMQFKGATLTEQDGVVLVFEGKDGILTLAQAPAKQVEVQKWRISPSTTVETVTIGDGSGEYVRGGWFGMGVKEGTASWAEEAAMQTLRWTDEGIQYTLWFTAAKTPSGIPALGKSELAVLAANIKAAPEGTFATTTADLSPQQAGVLAGFSVVEPQTLPSGFKLSKTSFSSQYNAVCLFYHHHPHDGLPSLALIQSSWAMPAVEELQVKAEFNDTPVEIASEVESIPLEGAAGGAAALVTTGLDPSKICNGEQAQVNRALLWQSGGRNYILFASLDLLDGRGYLSKLEMRRLAESLNGIQARSEAEIDPERMTSIEMAEAFGGIDLKSPALMLADLHLDHIAYNNYGPYQGSEGETLIAQLFTGGPVGDGRAYKILVMQTIHPENTLENLALAGAYEATAVNGWPAIYQQSCWAEAEIGDQAGCRQHLAWFEDAKLFEIETFLPANLPEEMLLEIAESMQ